MTDSGRSIIRAALVAACLIGGGAARAEGPVVPRALPFDAVRQPHVTRASFQPAPTPQVSYDAAYLSRQPAPEGGEDWRCLAEALYFEARGESVRGQFAVGEVILNRVDSPGYPATVCGVVTDRCQFSYMCDGRPEAVHEPRAWARVGKVARLLLDGAPRRLTEGATHYHTKAVAPGWADVFPLTVTIGYHRFYREPLRTAMK